MAFLRVSRILLSDASVSEHAGMSYVQRAVLGALVVGVLLILHGCSRHEEKPETIRPVRVMAIASDHATASLEFPGDVRARVESRLGFQVPGKIVSRHVELGTAVTRGRVLMQLDPRDFELAKMQAGAALKAAESNHELAQSELVRYRELREKNFVSQAVLDGKISAARAAQASHDQALAAYRNQTNQAGYTNLVADADGVVTGVDAEVGQVVAAGTPVVRLARVGEKEIVFGIPEDKLPQIKVGQLAQVRLWALPNLDVQAKVREISPVADTVTRTYAVRVSLVEAPTEVQLGMSATVRFTSQEEGSSIRLPLAALFYSADGSAVWTVENDVVSLKRVNVVGNVANDVLISAELAPGAKVVTAGVNLLREGQRVKLLDKAPKLGQHAPAGVQQ